MAEPSAHPLRWRALIVLTAGVGAVIGAAWLAFPDHTGMVVFGAYAVQSHALLSPFPIEPPLLHIAQVRPVLLVAALAAAGSLIAGLYDGLILPALLHHPALRPRYRDNRLFRGAHEFFMAFPFLFLVLAHVTPIPYYPFKFLAFAAGYPFWRYELAILLGRLPRYVVLAWVGHAVAFPWWALALLAATMVGVAAVRLRGSLWSGRDDS